MPLKQHFRGVTPLLAVFYAPIVAYVLWAHFEHFGGSPAILLVPVVAAIAAGYFDRKRPFFQCALWLTLAAYFLALLDVLFEIGNGGLHGFEIALAPLFPTFWFGMAILPVTAFFTAIGKSLSRTRWRLVSSLSVLSRF